MLSRSGGPATAHVALATGALVLAAIAVSGCGSTDAKPAAPASTPLVATSFPDTPQPTATAPNDIKTTTTSSAIPVPEDGPSMVANFPVPEGVRVKGPGPQDQSWQFDITTKDTDAVLAFYRKALADEGYTVRNDVNVTIGIEKVHYDIEFSGKAEGYIVADKQADDVFVLVQSLPAS